MEEKILRYFDTTVRALDTEKRTVEGYALKFDKETLIGSEEWGWYEKIDRSAMETADIKDVILNFNHSWDRLMARTTNSTLRLTMDDIGLKIEADLVDTTESRDVFKMIQENLINRMSFAAYITGNKWEESEGELDRRTITKFGRFFDVSAVTFPAYDDTIISARSDLNVADHLVKEHFEQKSKQQNEQIYKRQMEKLNNILRRD